MTDRERYRAAFAVKAPKEAVQRALDQARGGAGRRRRTIPRVLLAAALIGALLVTSVSAEIGSGAVTNLLAPYFGSARTELLEKFGRPVGASASAGGYTITADAIIGDRGCMQVIYTLTSEDGQPIPEHVKFLDIGYTIRGGGTSCSTVYPASSDSNESQFYQKFFADFGLSRKVRVSFGRLVISDNPDREPELLAEGPWELSFIRRYPDTTRTVPVNDLTVTDRSGQSCHIRTLSCSCLGLTITGTASFSESDAAPTPDLTASVTLKDGSVLPLQTGFSAERSGPVWTFTCHARVRDQDGFGLLDPDHIAAVTLCGVTIPVP